VKFFFFFYWWWGSEISGVPPSQVYLNGTALIEFDIKSIGYIYQIKTNLFNEAEMEFAIFKGR
jgi:hypothetical protein